MVFSPSLRQAPGCLNEQGLDVFELFFCDLTHRFASLVIGITVGGGASFPDRNVQDLCEEADQGGRAEPDLLVRVALFALFGFQLLG